MVGDVGAKALCPFRLDQIPRVATDIPKHRDSTERLVTRRFVEVDSGRD